MRWDHKELLCLVFNLALQGYFKKGLNVFSDGGITGICRSLPEVINFTLKIHLYDINSEAHLFCGHTSKIHYRTTSFL